MKQLTIKGLDEPLEQSLRELAIERGISLNRAALILMRRGAGLPELSQPTERVGSALDTFIGVWSAEDEAEFLAAIKPLARIDPHLWS